MVEGRLILVSTGIIARLPDDEDMRDALVIRMSDALQAAAKAVADGLPECQASGTVTFHYLGDDSENAERCSSCGQWASNLNKPDLIDCIQSGDSQAGQFQCIPCQTIERERRARNKKHQE